jgi:Fic family protein
MVLRAALAHLWFVTIHPFEESTGRIARAVAEWALARSENSPQRLDTLQSDGREAA